MTIIELIETDKGLYECDDCKSTFTAEEIKLVDPADNFKILTPGFHFMCVEKDGTICGKADPKKEDGDKLLSCPKCGYIHFTGFNKKSKETICLKFIQ